MEKNIEVAKSLIKYYNARTLCSIRTTSENNQECIFKALEVVKGDINVLKDHMRKWLDANSPDDYDNDLERFRACFAEVSPVKSSEDLTVANSIGMIGNVVAEALKSTCVDKIETDIMSGIQEKIEKFFMENYGPSERKITTIVDGNKHEVKGFVHEKFDEVVQYIAKNQAVWLVGPAGSGKNVLCKQVADALGLKFYFTNAVTQEYKLTGFTDAMGNYQPTSFYKAFTEGGLFMLDEIDASIPEVLITLNAVLANKYFDFPAPIGYKEAHPNFRVIAAGNTSGNGADFQYVGRTQLDGSSIDRFKYVDVDYCKEIEDGLAGDITLANFCREFRAASKKVGVNIIVSYRAIEGIATMLPVLPLEKVLKSCLVKSLEKDDLRMIIRELRDTPYKQALDTIYNGM